MEIFGEPMPKPKTMRLGFRIPCELYDQLCRIAEKDGQSKRTVVEKALQLYFLAADRSQPTVRQEVLQHFRKSTRKNATLLRLLAR